MPGYVHLRKRADRLFHDGDAMGALLAYRRLLELHPHDHAARLHVGDALARLGLPGRAAQVYAAVALAHLRYGRPLQGVAALCALQTVQPDDSVFPTLASLYGRGSPNVDSNATPLPVSAPPSGPVDQNLEPMPPAQLLRSVVTQAATIDAEPEPPKLPPLPILSDLDEEDLARVLTCVERRRFPDGAPILCQGDAGDSFYLLCHGGARVTRADDTGSHFMTTLGPGTMLGEIALVTKAPRTATVTALGDVDAVEVPVHAITRIAGDRRGVADALDRFTRDRLLRDTVASSAIFKPFLPNRIGDVLPLFTARDFDPGACLLREGQIGDGLYVLMSGECVATRTEGHTEVELGRIGPRDVVGEMSLLGDRPAEATITATSPTITLFMNRDAFDDLIERYPEVRDELERLGGARRVINAFILDEDAFLGSDALDTTSEDLFDFYL